jgi:hypothetical protein
MRYDLAADGSVSNGSVYVFQHFNPSNRKSPRQDEAISEAKATYWTNFARRGDNNGEGLPAWPDFSDANPLVMYFSQRPIRNRSPAPNRSRFWMRTSRGGGRRKVRRGQVDRVRALTTPPRSRPGETREPSASCCQKDTWPGRLR